MIKKLFLITLLSISVFGDEIVVDKTVKKLDIKVEKNQLLKEIIRKR